MARKTKRSRLTPEDWRAVLERQHESGLGPTAFCRREGLVLATFHKCKARFASTEPEAWFVELKRCEGGGTVWSMELALPHGVVLPGVEDALGEPGPAGQLPPRASIE